ncbi:MAG: carboxymuconolactone decarboxylase family protein [Candidatus Brocadiae bacterium]|nr:carboxymuconolactone decarboxylase family protein [Candidatus Brocadiia bacterium]
MEQSTAQSPTAINATVAELMALAAAVATGYEQAVAFHVQAARKLGLSDEDLIQAVGVGLKLRQATTEGVVSTARELLAPGEKAEGGCGCGHDHGGCGSESESEHSH